MKIDRSNILARLHFSACLAELNLGHFGRARQQFDAALPQPTSTPTIEPSFDNAIREMAIQWLMTKPRQVRPAALANLKSLLAQSAHETKLARVIVGELQHVQVFESYANGAHLSTVLDGVKGLAHSQRAREDRGLWSLVLRSIPRSAVHLLSTPVVMRAAKRAARHAAQHTAASANPQIAPHAQAWEDLAPQLRQDVEAALGAPVSQAEAVTFGYSNALVFSLQTTASLDVYILRVILNDPDACTAHANALRLAAKVSPPVPRLVAHGAYRPNGASWLLQVCLPGHHFDLMDFGMTAQTDAVLRDAVHALQQIHKIPVIGFGRLLNDDASAEFATWADAICYWAKSMEMWIQSGVLSADYIPVIAEALWHLMEADITQAILCHGDLSGRNILADAGTLTGIIDWDEACGSHPLWDIAALILTMDLTCAPDLAQHYDNVILCEYFGAPGKSHDGHSQKLLAAMRVVLAAWTASSSADSADCYFQNLNKHANQVLKDASVESHSAVVLMPNSSSAHDTE